MTKRIFRSMIVVALAVFLAAMVLTIGVLYTYFTQIQQQQLRAQTAFVAQAMENEGVRYLQSVQTDKCRITWIDAGGTVLFDSESEQSQMENHLQREEVQQALKIGYGESSRYSATLMERSLYAAQRLSDGTVLRLSVSQNSVLTLVLGMSQSICVIFVVAVLLSLLLASRLAKRVVKPLNELNLEDPLANTDYYDELSPLLRRIDSQQKQLRLQSAELRRQRDEFDSVAGNMCEGLVLLNDRGCVLSMNPAAAKMLGAHRVCTGQSILTVNRNLELQQLVNDALEGKSGERTLHFPSGEYQLDVNPVYTDGVVSGAALLLFDVTEKQKVEAMRREFTANVSHELNTPLQSISGYAELMCRGIAREEDTRVFSEKIYSEAQRLIQLVEDIIRLSRLDEGMEDVKREPVDLYGLAQEVIHGLTQEAAQAQVSVSLQGGSAVINGIPQLLSGIVFNLCDNAIKYNRVNGSVVVEIQDTPETAVLTVRDTGIGIPAEHQGRIFERFYRVDKSHSKAVGGTGLGLSIVKHAAMIHHAKIELQSTVGEGTTVTIRFPKEG